MRRWSGRNLAERRSRHSFARRQSGPSLGEIGVESSWSFFIRRDRRDFVRELRACRALVEVAIDDRLVVRVVTELGRHARMHDFPFQRDLSWKDDNDRRHGGSSLLLSVLSYNVWQDLEPLGWDSLVRGKNFFEIFDFTLANILLPLNGVLTAIFAGWVISASKAKRHVGIKKQISFEGGVFFSESSFPYLSSRSWPSGYREHSDLRSAQKAFFLCSEWRMLWGFPDARPASGDARVNNVTSFQRGRFGGVSQRLGGKARDQDHILAWRSVLLFASLMSQDPNDCCKQCGGLAAPIYRLWSKLGTFFIYGVHLGRPSLPHQVPNYGGATCRDENSLRFAD